CQPAAITQPARRLLDQAVEDANAQRPAVEGQLRFMATDLRVHGLAPCSGDVRRVAGDQVDLAEEGRLVEGREQVAATQLDAVGEAEMREILRGERDRFGR